MKTYTFKGGPYGFDHTVKVHGHRIKRIDGQAMEQIRIYCGIIKGYRWINTKTI